MLVARHSIACREAMVAAVQRAELRQTWRLKTIRELYMVLAMVVAW